MRTLNKIGVIEGVAFLIIVMSNQIILNLPKSILLKEGSGAWLNTIYITFISFLICLLIIKLFKAFGSEDIIDVSEFLGGRVLKSVIGLCYLYLFILSSSIALRYFSECLKSIYFHDSPIVYITLFFIVGIIITNRLGFKSVLLTNLFVIPIVLIGLVVIFFSIAPQFDFERIFPILGYGTIPTFFSGISNISAFLGFSFLYFLMPMLNKKEDFKKITLISLAISSLYLFISVCCLLLSSPISTTTQELFSIYVLTRSIEYGGFFQRVDAIFIFIWILSTLSYLSVLLMLILRIFKKLTSIKHPKQMVYCFSALILGFALLPKNVTDTVLIEQIVYKYSILIIVFGISLPILILGYLKRTKREKYFQNTRLVKE